MELAEDVERLVRLAYPEAAESMVEVLAKEQFVDALPDEDVPMYQAEQAYYAERCTKARAGAADTWGSLRERRG